MIGFDSKGQLPNSPANDHWELQLSTTPISVLESQTSIIAFLPNGSLDLVRTNISDLQRANLTLQPTVLALKAKYGLDFWQFMNWFFVSLYWTVLADFGQVKPVTIDDNGVAHNLSQDNNIFINPSLFKVYGSYLQGTIFPLLNATDLPNFAELNGNNSFQVKEAMFARSYSCRQREWKSPLEVLISVITADYAWVGIVLLLFATMASQCQKRQASDTCRPWLSNGMTLGNYCEGCKSLTEAIRGRTESEGSMSETSPQRTVILAKEHEV